MLSDHFTASDMGGHAPDPGDELWSESFCIVWHDPITKSGGNHHFHLWRNRGICDNWSWVAMDGREVGREQFNENPIPDQDLTDITVGGMHVVSHGDFRRYTLDHVFATGRATIEYEAYIDPVELHYTQGGAALGKRHYETLGKVAVRLEFASEVRHVTGVAFQDHSWGHRELERNPAGQFGFAVWGPDLMSVFYARATVEGLNYDGWIYRDGAFQPIRRIEVVSTVGNDGLLPRSATFDLWTDTGGMRVNGVSQFGVVEGGIGLLAGDGMAVYETGGRLGGGMLEVKPLRFALPQHRALLNIPSRAEELAWYAQPYRPPAGRRP